MKVEDYVAWKLRCGLDFTLTESLTFFADIGLSSGKSSYVVSIEGDPILPKAEMNMATGELRIGLAIELVNRNWSENRWRSSRG